MRATKILVLLWLVACTARTPQDVAAEFDPLAEQYVKLALALGQHDPDYVDAYFGPKEWRDDARESAKPR
ncbi:MAG: hypothetical protein OEW64_08260 [Gammaproteobacteria bacterium]|nr:hypothetical protein [Gammaproteobacteria bacterium]MDH5304078.1 hypothetical protein [Gammaproteobacteria bacterium]MDH5323439.1 hypothetical protein [Gammaproteobacteria bacterium]